MSVPLRIDPRTAKTFADFKLPAPLLAKLGSQFVQPRPIQAKMLALNASGVSVFAKSTPNQGKTTASMLGLLSTPPQPAPQITNLVLVPTPALADHYQEQMSVLGGANHAKLYRTGSIDDDEQQHQQLLLLLKAQKLASVISTPQRVLDYLSADSKLLDLMNLKQIVIDEFDVFGSPPVLETLVEFVLQTPQSNPVFTLMTSRMNPKEFMKLPHLLASKGRVMYEASEPDPEWQGTTKSHSLVHNAQDIGSCAKRIKQIWTGPGLVIPPPGASASQLQSQLQNLDGAVIVQPSEVAGLQIEGLANIYILAADEHAAGDIERLKWLLSAKEHTLHLINRAP